LSRHATETLPRLRALMGKQPAEGKLDDRKHNH
jgi:hypothetical protein